MKKFFPLLLVLLLCVACNDYKKVTFEDVKLSSINIVGLDKANVGIDVIVNNPTKSKFILDEAYGVFYKDTTSFATFNLLEESVVVPHSCDTVPVNLQLQLTNPKFLLSLGLNLGELDVDDFSLDANLRVKNGAGLGKRVKLEDIKVKDLLEIVNKGK